MSEENKPQQPVGVIIPPIVLGMLNYGIKILLPLAALFLFTRWGIVIPIQQSQAKIEAAVREQTAIVQANSWR